MLLQSEKYSGLIIALLSHGEELANGSEGEAMQNCNQEMADEGRSVVFVLNQKLTKLSA